MLQRLHHPRADLKVHLYAITNRAVAVEADLQVRLNKTPKRRFA